MFNSINLIRFLSLVKAVHEVQFRSNTWKCRSCQFFYILFVTFQSLFFLEGNVQIISLTKKKEEEEKKKKSSLLSKPFDDLNINLKASLSGQVMTSHGWYSMEKLADDYLLGITFVNPAILSNSFRFSLAQCIIRLRSLLGKKTSSPT